MTPKMATKIKAISIAPGAAEADDVDVGAPVRGSGLFEGVRETGLVEGLTEGLVGETSNRNGSASPIWPAAPPVEFVLSRPSSPNMLMPQHLTPFDSCAQVCLVPAVTRIATWPEPRLTKGSALPSVVGDDPGEPNVDSKPSPSCP